MRQMKILEILDKETKKQTKKYQKTKNKKHTTEIKIDNIPQEKSKPKQNPPPPPNNNLV
jgi:hypothetical protein